MPASLLTALGLAALALCLLLAAFLWFGRGPLQQANRYLAGFLLLTAVDVVGWLAPLLPEWLQALLPWRFPLAFLQMPLLHAYGRQLCFPGRPMRRLWWLAGLQLLAVLVALLLGLRYRGGIDLPGLALHVQFYAYFIALVVLLRRYRRVYAQTCSNPGSITGPWLTVVLVVSFVAHGLVLTKWLVAFAGPARWFGAMQVSVGFSALLILAALTLVALLRQHWFLGVPVEADTLAPAATTAPPAPVDPADFVRLQTHMAEQRPYLDPDLNIRVLAAQMGMPQRALSQLINRSTGMHFYDFVNRHRVEHAARLLAEPAGQGITLVDLAMQVGFNSKSSFNSAFRKHQGSAPSVWRNQQASPATD